MYNLTKLNLKFKLELHKFAITSTTRYCKWRIWIDKKIKIICVIRLTQTLATLSTKQRTFFYYSFILISLVSFHKYEIIEDYRDDDSAKFQRKFISQRKVMKSEVMSEAWPLFSLEFNVLLGISRDPLWAMKISYVKSYTRILEV